ncbi:trypsin-like peptidase domain-containing protein [Saccharopolyspora sp. NPDC002686]|uniref:trypsin-like peptidase domain-containing protein n=1 Tax=Saccharopolyspora sp. NPDC002686 TaxID=3154541 RepID=UPI00331DBD20
MIAKRLVAQVVPLLGVVVLTAGYASAAPDWAAASTAAVHPGVQTVTGNAQCTSNFVFESGSKVYIGQAAHCATTGAVDKINGCTSPSRPIGTKVRVTGASKEGVLVYSSWLTMQAIRETDANACAHNDLALVELDPADVAKVNPSLPIWGGPTGLNTAGLRKNDEVVTYGSAQLGGEATDPNAKRGTSLGDSAGGWNHTIRTTTPGLPGDSGSAVLDAAGRAVGVLSTLNISPDFGSNGVGDLAHELNYLHAHSALRDVHLVTGTQSFRPLR